MTLAKRMYDVDNIEVEEMNEMQMKSIKEIMKKLTEKKRTRDFTLGGIDLGTSPFGSFLLGKSDDVKIKDPEYNFWQERVKFLPNMLRGMYGNIDPMSELLMSRRLGSEFRKGFGRIAPGMNIKDVDPNVLKEMGADVYSAGYRPQDANLYLTSADKKVGMKGNDFQMHFGKRSGISDNKYPRTNFDKNGGDEMVLTPSNYELHVDNGVLLNPADRIPVSSREPDQVYHFSADYLANTGHVIRPKLIRGKDRRIKLELGPDRWHRFGDHYIDDSSMINANFVPYGDGAIHRSSLIPLKQKIRNNSMNLAKNFMSKDENREKIGKAMVGGGLVNPTTIKAVKSGGKALIDVAKKKLVSEIPTIANVVTTRGKDIDFDNAISTGAKIITEGKQLYDKVKGVGSRIKGMFKSLKRKRRTPTGTLPTPPTTGEDLPIRSSSRPSSSSLPSPSKKRRRGVGGSIENNQLLRHLKNFNYF